MNCEQVEELLSAYLDNALAPEEQDVVTTHLRGCSQCSSILADFRRFDLLLSQLPRISPRPALRDRIFSSAEYLELTGTFASSGGTVDDHTFPKLPVQGHTRPDRRGRPQLVALPGGRSTLLKTPASTPTQQQPTIPIKRQRRTARSLRFMQVSIVAAVLLTLAVGGLISRNLWLQQTRAASNNGAITPPAGLQQQGPLPVGIRFMFLRDGALWSTPADGSTKAVRLTTMTVTVATNWVVSPALPGSAAGDMLAYIDLQHALIHTIRSDGQDDTAVQQPLLKAGIEPATLWDTDTGAAILSSLTWSQDGSMLAFVGDPNGTGLTNLYILSMDTGSVQVVPLSIKGSATHPVWSPDGVRLAFELAHDGIVSIMDYNTQNHGVLTIDAGQTTGATDAVLNLDWAANTSAPAITWSVGVLGHVHSIWLRHVGTGARTSPQQLIAGDYVQAIYSRSGHAGVGSWLLVASIAGREGDLSYVDAISGTRVIPLTTGRQVGLAWWSPDGREVDYFDMFSTGLGNFRVVNTITGVDLLLDDGVSDEPTPAWSSDSEELVYSTGIQTFVANLRTGQKMLLLKLQGPASTFAWFATSPSHLVAVLRDNQQGIYLVDVRHNASQEVDTLGLNGPIVWTEIP